MWDNVVEKDVMYFELLNSIQTKNGWIKLSYISYSIMKKVMFPFHD